MNSIQLTLCATAALAAPQSVAPPQSPAALRSVRHSAIVHAAAAEVWSAVATPQGVVRAWGVAQADLDLRIGGALRTHHDIAGVLGDERTVVHPIMALEPGAMLSLRGTAPHSAAPRVREMLAQSWTVITIEPLAPHRARLSICGTSTADGEDGETAFELLDSGNRWMLDAIRGAFDVDAERAQVAHAWTTLSTWVGGEWISEQARAGGGVTRSRVRLTPIVSGAFLLEESWLGDERGLKRNAHTIYGIDPESGAVEFWSFEPGGAMARGSVRSEGATQLLLDWRTANANGAFEELECVFDLAPPDEHRLRIYAGPGVRAAGQAPALDLLYRRVASLPAGFEERAEEGK